MNALAVEEELLILLSLAEPRPDEREHIRLLSERARDWDLFWELARHNATVPLVQYSLEREGLFDRLPEPIKARFQKESMTIREANNARLQVARTLFARFAERRISVVILKGVLFAETLYRNPYYKRMNDVDILVRKSDMDAIYDVYHDLSFWCGAELMGGSPRKQEKFSHHAPPFFSRNLKFMVGTHWGLITPLSPYTLDYDAIWSRVETISFYGHPALAMSPTDNLHHLCVHLPYYKTGIRELADIYNLVRHGRTDGSLFRGEIAKARTENLVYHALHLAHRLSPMPEAATLLEELEPRVSRFTRNDVARKTTSISRLLRSRSTHLSVVEKHFADLRATKSPGEKWISFFRMWQNLLFPPGPDVARLCSVDRPTLWTRFAAQSRIRRVFYRDLGRLLFWVMAIATALDVLKTTLLAPFRRRRAEDYSAYANQLGVTVEDLRRLKEALE